jgi:hypothetical protein
VHSYPAAPCPVGVSADEDGLPAGVLVAVRACGLVPPLKSGVPLGEADRSALAVAGTKRIATGEAVVFCKVVAVAPAQVTRDGQVRAQGSPCGHARPGPLEDWLESQAGPGVIDRIAEHAVLDGKFIKGDRKRLLTAAFAIRALLLMTLSPDGGIGDAAADLAGDLALVPWAKPWDVPSERSLGDWLRALGPDPLEDLQAEVLGAAWAEHEENRDRNLTVGKERELRVRSGDGTLFRVPDTPANRAAFGTVGTGDGSSPWPCVRALPVNSVLTRSLLAMPWGPSAGTGKASGEQYLLDRVLEDFPHLFTFADLLMLDRNWPGARRLARLARHSRFLVRVKSGLELQRVPEILADGSYLATASGDGVTITVRVIEYFVDVEGKDVPEMFCLVTDLLDWNEYPAPELAGLYKWRWDGSETGLRETKAPLHGAGPGTGPMLRSGSPDLVAQELAALTAAVEMARGVTRDAAGNAPPARKGRRAGQRVRSRDLSHARAVRAILAAVRAGKASYKALTRTIAGFRVITDRNRHRARVSKSPGTFPHATAKGAPTRTAPAVITMANKPS